MTFQRQPWKSDPRSKKFSHERFFGSAPLTTLPDSLNRPFAPVLNQQYTLRCTGYGSATNGWYVHHKNFSPDWQAAKIGQIQGRSVDESGADPNACMKSMRDYGWLPTEDAPYSLEKDGLEASGFTAWPRELDEKARAYDNIPGYVRVDGQYDTFDNIRNALFKAYDPVTKKGAVVDAFSAWYSEWNAGIIPSSYSNFAGYHRFVFVDYKLINGVYYLMAQNSYGTQYGSQGFHMFPREVVNREFTKYGTSLKILKTLTKEQIQEAKKETPLGLGWRFLLDAWYLLSEHYGRFKGVIMQYALRH